MLENFKQKTVYSRCYYLLINLRKYICLLEDHIPCFKWVKASEIRYHINLRLCLHCRSSYQRCSITKGVLKSFAKLTGKHLCQNLFFKNELWHRCFPVNFAKFLKTALLWNTSGRLLLHCLSIGLFLCDSVIDLQWANLSSPLYVGSVFLDSCRIIFVNIYSFYFFYLHKTNVLRIISSLFIILFVSGTY